LRRDFPEKIRLKSAAVNWRLYADLEHQILKTLVEKDCYFRNIKYKPHQHPTARWVFQCFEDITVTYWLDYPPIVVNLQTRN